MYDDELYRNEYYFGSEILVSPIVAKKDTVMELEYIDGELVDDYEPINFKDVDNTGKDNLAAVRSALGK